MKEIKHAKKKKNRRSPMRWLKFIYITQYFKYVITLKNLLGIADSTGCQVDGSIGLLFQSDVDS